jgi:hypothetical protein
MDVSRGIMRLGKIGQTAGGLRRLDRAGARKGPGFGVGVQLETPRPVNGGAGNPYQRAEMMRENLPRACSKGILAQNVSVPTGNPHAARRGKRPEPGSLRPRPQVRSAGWHTDVSKEYPKS